MTAVEDEDRRNRFNALTPTQQLVLEVLGARWRLGHKLWTFSRNQTVRKGLMELEAHGLVTVMSPVVDGTIRGALTSKGRDLILDPAYRPPGELL